MSWNRPRRYGFVFEGEPYRLHPDLAGVDLAIAAMHGEWTYLVPEGLIASDRDRLLRRLLDRGDELDIPDLYSLALILARQVYGVAWHVAGRLCGLAEADWTAFYGWCVVHGVEPREMSADQICAVVWAWISDRLGWADADKHKQVRDQIWGPADNQLDLIRAGILLPVSEEDRVSQQQELASWGLPAPDASKSTA